jgi:ABC-2 type transport system ATP-binding protein
MARLGRIEADVALAQPLDAIPSALSGFALELSEDRRTLIYRSADAGGEGQGEVAALIKALVAQGIDFTGIDQHRSSLEEIFVRLVEAN